MIQHQHRRLWFLIALFAVGVALLLMLAPHGHSTGDSAWLAILPVIFVGLISAPSQVSRLAALDPARVPSAPLLPASFQRPPPFIA